MIFWWGEIWVVIVSLCNDNAIALFHTHVTIYLLLSLPLNVSIHHHHYSLLTPYITITSTFPHLLLFPLSTFPLYLTIVLTSTFPHLTASHFSSYSLSLPIGNQDAPLCCWSRFGYNLWKKPSRSSVLTMWRSDMPSLILSLLVSSVLSISLSLYVIKCLYT